VVFATLDTDLGRSLADDLDAPVRSLVAVPVLAMAAIVFATSVAALVLPDHRKRLLGVAGITGWLIPAWLLMAATLIGAVALVLARLD
jgi:hypothetical protein